MSHFKLILKKNKTIFHASKSIKTLKSLKKASNCHDNSSEKNNS
jgi:hypothetical protein